MTTTDAYRPRIADVQLQQLLEAQGAVVIEGPKACGKTWTASNLAASRVDVDIDPTVPLAMETDPRLLLQGATPRLLDEWQTRPTIWDWVRREVDARHQTGQFILTGSATPSQDARIHSGAGRIGWLRMRPMSLWESGDSTGQVRLNDLFEQANIASAPSTHTIPDLARLVVRGGWPETLNMSAATAQTYSQSYLRTMSEVDLSKFTGQRRDPVRVRRLLQSLARAESAETSVRSLTTDTGQGDDQTMSRDTVIDYLAALERSMVTEDQPAWSVSLRSRAELRNAPVRRLADPSLAAAALGAGVDRLMADLNTLGLLFESLVVRDLRTYAQALGGNVYHYRDSNNHEIDAVIELADGTWGACEIKLGVGAVDDATESLHDAVNQIDTTKAGKPAFLAVITGNGLSTRRKDGTYVVPIGALRP